MIDAASIEAIKRDLPFKTGDDGKAREAWYAEQGIDGSLETGLGKWAMAETEDDMRRVHGMLATGVPVAALRRAMQSAAYELGFMLGWLARDRKPAAGGETRIERLLEHLLRQGNARLSIVVDNGEFSIGYEFGSEAPGSPMYGAASYAIEPTLEGALEVVVKEVRA